MAEWRDIKPDREWTDRLVSMEWTSTSDGYTDVLSQVTEGLGWRAHLLEELMARMMQVLWGTERRDEVLQGYDWDSKPNSRVKVVQGGQLDTIGSGLDLKLVVESGETEFIHETTKGRIFKNTEDGKVVTYLAKTPIVVRSVARLPVLASMSAAEVAIRLKEGSHIAQNKFVLHDWTVESTGRIEQASSDSYVCDAQVSITVPHSHIEAA